jgi:hypothetical protein
VPAAFSQNEVGVIAAGAVSRPSIVVTRPPAVRTTMKPPPPMPHENGSVTPRTPAAATAASTALPPCFSVSIAVCVAILSTLAAAPPVPIEVGGPEPDPTSVEALATSSSAAAIVRKTTDQRNRSRGITASFGWLKRHDRMSAIVTRGLYDLVRFVANIRPNLSVELRNGRAAYWTSQREKL